MTKKTKIISLVVGVVMSILAWFLPGVHQTITETIIKQEAIRK